jgi:beta-glucosidase
VICRFDGNALDQHPPQFKICQFPRGFLWGASTSSHQVEGDNHWNDWWEYEQSGRLPYRSGDACRHYERFEQDFDLARSWGHNAHRFSIEWSRIEPSEGHWNTDALVHYREVIRALRERGLEPVVTLHHFTNPAWFSRSGGWLRKDSARLFARYAEQTIKNLGAEVKYWLTINEPTDYVMQGYINGEWPPFLKSAWIKAASVFRNLSRAHVAAYRALHRNRSDIMVGFAHNASFFVPCNSGRRSDRVAARIRDFIWNRAFFHLIGTRRRESRQAAGNLDFIGLNYYKRTIVRSSGWGIGAVLGRTCQLPHHHDRGTISATGWEVYPAGLKAVLENFSQFGLPLLVTENGIATDDESLRREFVIKHLESLANALETGVNVIGYLYWSLIDNFEWALGTKPRFGLAAIDYSTQQRLPRPCVEDFSRVCRENQLFLSLQQHGSKKALLRQTVDCSASSQRRY